MKGPQPRRHHTPSQPDGPDRQGQRLEVAPQRAHELHEVDCVIWAAGFKATEFMFPWRSVVARQRPARGVDRRTARPSRDDGSGDPVVVHHVRTKHQYVGRLDRLRPRSPAPVHQAGLAVDPARRRHRGCIPKTRRPAIATFRRGSRARAGRGVTRGNGTSGIGSWPTRPVPCARTPSIHATSTPLSSVSSNRRRGSWPDAYDYASSAGSSG